ncbi:HSP90 family protein [Telmatocola sphagniphila]|uniref:HSP90 family protein n=1 Tax=Telmatocola sphagniphila TaxID=1123043 RepID=A0A8E6B4S6_9BACT|nr:HSP90 family protein [Telmatocola sphagniphila]QVL31337.1 HSP90 family protein [Telmatocola sphagniphila]
MAHKFQIHLRGIIDLLSKHLYSGPEVFVRELLQNGVDAIRARKQIDADHQGEITLELITPKGKPATLIVSDNGIGLTEEEVHRFLATIGESSKRAIEGEKPLDFIGQFGVGLLSCFVVSEEVVVISRSAKPDSKTVEWRGRPDGTYDLKILELDFQPGTQVCLTARPDQMELMTDTRIPELAEHFGGLLPIPIHFAYGSRNWVVNEKGAPWRQEFVDDKERARVLLAYGKEIFNTSFLDAIPLLSPAGQVDGVAFVLSHEVNLAAKRTHRVYLKNMLLSESADNLLPEWAFFVKAVVNANALRPMASRESFYEDEALDQTREELGNCLRRYLIQLADKRPEKFASFVELHYRALKALAAQDDEFFHLIIDMLPFQTNRGTLPFGEIRRLEDRILQAPTTDQFRQVDKIARAQGLLVINAGYTYDADLLSRAAENFDLTIEEIEAGDLARELDEPTPEDLKAAQQLLQVANQALKPFRCETELKSFKPHDLSALFATTREGRFFRSLEQSKEVADPLWAGVLDSLGSARHRPSAESVLTLNANNALIRKLFLITDRVVLRKCVEVLYVQSLLLAQQPLSTRELNLLNQGVIGLIEWGLR